MGFLTDALNLGFGIEKMNYEKRMQEKTWEREDTAVERRVADLKAAGLSPTLAAGSAAQTSSPIDVTQPRMEDTGAEKAATMMGMLRMKEDISKTQADTALSKLQAEGVKTQTLLNEENIRLSQAERERRREEINALKWSNLVRKHDWDILKDSPLRSDERNIARDAEGILNFINGLVGKAVPGTPAGSSWFGTVDRLMHSTPMPKAPQKRGWPFNSFDGPSSGTDMHNRASTRPR